MIKEELEKLQERCNAHNIPFEEYESEGDKHWTVGLPCGREKEWIYLYELDHIKRLLAIPFERYVFLGSYVAICSYEEGTIEAGIRTPERAPYIHIHLLGSPLPTLIRRQNWTLELKTQEGGDEKRVKIGPISDTLHTLWYHSLLGERPEPKYKRRYEYPLTLRIEGIQVSRHEQALDLLERIANSLFFQTDLCLNVLLSLVRKTRFSVSIASATSKKERTNLQFPQYEYDKAPMDLYWYARTAVGMPLLQFLAYYQTIEYYFSTYSKAEARKRIRGILKDLTFRPDRDADIGRILSVIGTGHRYGFRNELSQLKATLQECLDPDQVRSFLESDEERKKFFSSITKGLTDVSIPINDTTADLRDKVAERIYRIRCKIVHTKSGNSDKEMEFLLPSSKEAELLSLDIELVQYVARQVLITASSPLQIRV